MINICMLSVDELFQKVARNQAKVTYIQRTIRKLKDLSNLTRDLYSNQGTFSS